MTQDDRQKARRIFMEVADLPTSDRAAALDRTCASDPKLRAEVDALLHANGQAGGFMDSPTSDKGKASLSMHFEAGPSAGEQAGRQIGPYKLLELIGEGGFGSVWMAEQREPVKRRVALKLIKLGMDTKQVIARFEAERQALAMMDHPNIAKVLDAGSTETGRPYFVMEYIRGVPILEYCDKERLDTRSRLELFTNVCHAIQHAHQKGIIHRDIKPSNVLVTLHDGVAVPKVIDFGVAKATNSELTTKTLFTEHRQMIGTPAYMSPEQAEMSGLDIDTRSDVYSLGVLLYELLTGTTPFDVYDLVSKGYEQMLRIIREEEPHKPSTRVSELGDTSTRTAQLRRVDAKTLGSLLRGDLDWIVMKCLEKDRSRRYDTANGLAADIKRHLNDEPVTARAPSAGYKLRKFVRRNRAGVFAGVALVATLLAGVVAFAWQASEARHQRDLAVDAKESQAAQRKVAEAATAEAQQQEARAKEQEVEARKQEIEARKQEAEAKRQAAIAEAVARFQTEMLAAADPQKLLGDKVTVLQAMQAAIKELDQDSLADQPLVEAQVRRTIGTTLYNLGRYPDAEPLLRKSLTMRQEVLPAGHLDIGRAMHDLGLLLFAENKLAEAETLMREALAIHRAGLPPGCPDIASCLCGLGVVLRERNELAEAERLMREALAIFRAALPAGDQTIVKAIGNLAEVLGVKHEFTEGESLFREALEISRAAFPAKHPEIASSLNNLAAILGQQKKEAEAEPLLREALDIIRARFPVGHPRIALALSNLADTLTSENKHDEAEPLLREALEINRAKLPAGHPHLAMNLDNLARTLAGLNKLDEAEQFMREALATRRTGRAAGHPDIAFGLANLAGILKLRAKVTEAEQLIREALEIRRAALPAGRADFTQTMNQLADNLKDQGKLTEAETLMRESVAMLRGALPAGHPDLAVAINNLAVLLYAQNKLTEAEPLFREALAINRATLPAGHLQISQALSNLADDLRFQGRLTDAEPLYLEALAANRAALPAGHPSIADGLNRLGTFLMDQNKLADAEPLFREALEIHRASLPAGDPAIADSLNNLGTLLGNQNKLDKAEPLYREALAVRRAALAKGHPMIAQSLTNLGALLNAQNKPTEAEPLLREALEIHRSALTPVSRDVLATSNILFAIYTQLGKADEALALRRKIVESARAILAKDSPELAGELALYATLLLGAKAWNTAEPILRESLAIREKAEPDDWRTFNTKSMLGGALLGQNKLAEAEAFLLAGYRGMKEREASLPPTAPTRIPEALERLVQLYEATGNASEAAAWRGKLEVARAESGPASRGAK